jgi:archaellum component FlaG (FlaF/FlaG flagellin family)
MQIVRVSTGADGESHFEDVTPEQLALIVNNLGDGPITVNCRPSPSFSDYHPAPRRQYVVNLAGLAEFETADGSTRRLSPGDVLVAEDLTGHGHIARSLGEEVRVALAIPLAEGECCARP